MAEEHQSSEENGFSANVKSKMALERDEYFEKLEKWLQEAHAWQSVAAMFPYLLSGQFLQQTTGSLPTDQASPTPTSSHVRSNAPGWQSTESSRRNGSREAGATGSTDRNEGIEYQIPPIWKRFLAEVIDTVMLVVLRLIITVVALDIFAMINMEPLEPYTLDTLHTSLRIVDYKMAMEAASRILIWELMNRLFVCLFEALWLQHGINGCVGGATPGKSVMGLRVVQCRSITPVERADGTEAVLVTPGTDLGFPLALGRSVVKNLIMALIFPICFSLFSFRFNRTGYDIACHSLVVEDRYRHNRPHQQ